MDRLLCGDVGFADRVALRAAMKVASAGQQVAVLAPTTILASQHYATFLPPAGFPAKGGPALAFSHAQGQKETIEGIRTGRWTGHRHHRLLSRDIQVRPPGPAGHRERAALWVAKEKLKAFRQQRERLAMSATPVPRSLHFSLSGLRDMSLIETAPLNRLPVRTMSWKRTRASCARRCWRT